MEAQEELCVFVYVLSRNQRMDPPVGTLLGFTLA